MTYSPKPYSSADSLLADHKYLKTVHMLGQLALASKQVVDPNAHSFPAAIHSALLAEAEDKVFAVYDGYCLEGYEPELYKTLNKETRVMSWLEYYTRQIKWAMNEIEEELTKRGKE